MMQLQIKQCHRDDIEHFSELLETTGALSVTLTDEFDDPILEPTKGSDPMWPHVVILALYSNLDEAEQACQTLAPTHPNLKFSIDLVPDQDWERVCMADFKSQQFGKRLWVCPSWLTPPDPDAVNLILDPGLAFGTGTHATTSLCLTWLEQAQLDQQDIIDYGCGSGILALAALKLGAHHVHAIDIDEQALLATQNNADSNGITASQLTVGLPSLPHAPVDLLIANILLSPLLSLQGHFRTLLKDQGTLVVSGLLESQVPLLINAYQSDFTHSSTKIQGDWALVEFK